MPEDIFTHVSESLLYKEMLTLLNRQSLITADHLLSSATYAHIDAEESTYLLVTIRAHYNE